MSAEDVINELRRRSDPTKAAHSARYFKTGPGEYGEGDIFLGLTVPEVRAVARTHKDLAPADTFELLTSDEHEVRLCALIIMVSRFKRSKSDLEKSELFALFLSFVREGFVNNWDLIDTSAPTFGEYLLNDTTRLELLSDLALSESLWERRASIMLTFAFIRAGEYDDTFSIAEMLMNDSHDLIHKACGWMLREVGRRDTEALRQFLTTYAARMPRTELRYAIEKFDPEERKYWLSVRK